MAWVGFLEGLGYDDANIKAWFDRLQLLVTRHHFVIRDQTGGFCGELYYAVDKANRRAALDIKLVPGAQGRGLASQAFKRLIEHVFAVEAMVDAGWTQPSELNHAARRLYKQCGLRPTNRPAGLPEGESYWEIRLFISMLLFLTCWHCVWLIVLVGDRLSEQHSYPALLSD